MMKPLLPALCALVLAACGGGGSGDQVAPPESARAATLAVVAPAPPSASFDLATYKLPLPVDRNGGSGGAAGSEFAAWTLNPEQLVGFTDNYFAIEATGALVFTAPAN